MKKKLSNFIPIPWEWPTECFKTDCGHKLLIEIYFFKSIKIIKVTFLILNHFPVVFLPLCLPVVTPQGSAMAPQLRVCLPPLCLPVVVSGLRSGTRYPRSEFPPPRTESRGTGSELRALGIHNGETTTGRHNGRKTTGKWFKMRNVTFIILILFKK